MNRLFLGLRSHTGDAAGNVRELLDRITGIGRVKAISDLHRAPSADGSDLDEYAIVLALETEHPKPQVIAAVHDVVGRTAAGLPQSARFAVDAEVLDQQSCERDHATRSPLLLAALTTVAARAGAEVPSQHAPPSAESAAGRAAVVRISDTATLAPIRALDYDAIGDARASYHEVRPLSRFDLEIFARAKEAIGLRQSMHIMDVGCGTGRFSLLLAQAGGNVTGVDKSANMLAVARDDARAAKTRIAYSRADANHALPPGPFDAATFFFSVQYMQLQPAFWQRLEASLTSEGTVAFVTFPHVHFAQTNATRFFPRIASIDMARFPSVPALCLQLAGNGFADVVVADVVWHDEMPARTLISRTASRYLSTFHLLPEAEFQSGLYAMRHAYATVVRVARTIRATVISARRAL